jgi:hypothetical protein
VRASERQLVLTKDADEPNAPFEHAIEATLTTEGDHTILVWEERGMPTNLLAAYGAGVQVHVEDLAAYVAGGERCDAEARSKSSSPRINSWPPASPSEVHGGPPQPAP